MDRKIEQLKTELQRLLAEPEVRLQDLTPISLPTVPGVYRVFEKDADADKSVYVGQSTNLRHRIFSNHLNGHRRNSTLLRKLINSGKFQDEESAQGYLRDQCCIQYRIIHKKRERIRIEHFSIAVLDPEVND